MLLDYRFADCNQSVRLLPLVRFFNLFESFEDGFLQLWWHATSFIDY